MKSNIATRRIVQVAVAAIAAASGWVAAPAFAADASASTPLSAQAATVTRSLTQADAQVHQKTRAEVYRELVTAEKSGELARLNASYGGA